MSICPRRAPTPPTRPTISPPAPRHPPPPALPIHHLPRPHTIPPADEPPRLRQERTAIRRLLHPLLPIPEMQHHAYIIGPELQYLRAATQLENFQRPAVLPRGQQQTPPRPSELHQRLAVAGNIQAALQDRPRQESTPTITRQIKAVKGIIASGRYLGAIIISAHGQIGVAVAVEISGHHAIDNGELGLRRQRHQAEPPIAVIPDQGAGEVI